MEGLAEVSYDRQKHAFDDPLKEATDRYFQEGNVGETLLFRCVSFLTQREKDFYPSLCALLLLRTFTGTNNEKLDNELRTLIALGKREFSFGSPTLQKGYDALVSDLFLGGSPKEFTFKQLEKGGTLLRDPFPHLQENAELALLSLYLGHQWNEEDLKGKGEKLCEFFELLVNHERHLFQGVWIPEEGYHAWLLEIIDLLVKEESEPTIPYLRLMKKALGGAHLSKRTPPLSVMDRSLGFLKYQWKDLSLVTSLAGKKTGLGAIHKKGISVVSMGPHFIPLADSDYYGIFRPSNGSQEGFKDLSIESEEGRGKIEGWTRMVSPDEGGLSQSWLYFNLTAKEKEVSLTIRRSHETEKELYFVFFVSADRAQVEEGETFFPKALNRFEGKGQKVFFQKEETFFEIAPNFEGEMKLIPLAGGTHFWSANFLVAFSVPKKLSPYSWTLK